ncbi:uncharacterized protein [Nicotiana tomentosiformis]|uniref:uncharacterized protein n=1 Tax=Nicotiana tomentosiformis TaxID=4098 RepID=UPI00388C80DB
MTNENGNRTVPMVTANASTSRTTPTLAPTEKFEKFFGIDFKRWQQKMFFYLTTLSLQKFIKEDVPVLPDETPENERFLVIESWKHSDFLCNNYILSGLEDDPYNIYSNIETSKQLWIALERKYKTEDVGLKKFVAAKYLNYKMVDSKSVITQVQELQVIIHDLLAEDISQINTNKDFKNYLKHKRNELSLEDLIVRLRIEEDNKAAEKKGRGNSTIMGANIVEDRKRKKAYRPKNNPSKKRFNENCYNCGKAGHRYADCRAPKKDKKKGQANMVEKHEDVDDLLCFMNATWWEILRSGGLILESLAMFMLLGKRLLHIPKRRFLWEILQLPKLKDVERYL